MNNTFTVETAKGEQVFQSANFTECKNFIKENLTDEAMIILLNQRTVVFSSDICEL